MQHHKVGQSTTVYKLCGRLLSDYGGGSEMIEK